MHRVLKSGLPCVLAAALSASGQIARASNVASDSSTITNLLQLTQSLDRDERVIRDLNLEAVVCAASDSEIGAVVLRDATGVELVELGNHQPQFAPGDKIRIASTHCLLRRRDFGVRISAAPVVDNDGIHLPQDVFGEITLRAGRHPLQLDWFNQLREFSLDVTCQFSNSPPVEISGDFLSLAAGPHFVRGLRVQSYEGNWQNAPDFELLRPVKSGVAKTFDLGFRTQDEMAGLRFTGFFNAPQDGKYIFRTRSDDGSLLFIENIETSATKSGTASVPEPQPGTIGASMTNPDERRWISVEGRVTFVRTVGKGLEFELRSERNPLRVRIVDGAGIDPALLLNSRVRVTGAGRGVYSLDQKIVLGQLFAASAADLKFLEQAPGSAALPSSLTTVQQVQTLRLEDARRELPVHIHGVVTSVGPPYDFWLSIQDDTRGIFVDTHALSNAVPALNPACGESWEIIGHSGAGDFAPIIVADRARRLGIGRMPEPARPAWNELINGSMDVQWVEFQGLVTEVQSNRVSLLLAGGNVDVQMDGRYESELKQFEKSVVRIRGTLFAAWNTGTRELRVGNFVVRNASINVDVPAPTDPFDAVLKTPRDLLLFDAQATAFRRVKVRGQITHADAGRIFLTADGTGLRILPASTLKLNAGDLVDAVGYPEINGTSLLLREAIVRATGTAALPAAKVLNENELTSDGLDGTRVHVEGKLLGSHLEQMRLVLEMQSGSHLYLARLTPGDDKNLSLRPGSKLALDGIYAGQSGSRHSTTEGDSFELLLNSPADVTVLSRPSWWTLQRLLVIVGILLVVLIFAMVWITQLRRLVEQRTAQLQRETRERERIERQHALEAERSRIARDLHDDLGSSLTEIGALASTGQRPQLGETGHTDLFHAIAGKARTLIAALDVIVWAVNPEDNSLQSLADYLSGYAGEYLSSSDIACRFKVPVTFPAVTLDGRVRHDLLMAVKESLNNIVRHASATEVEFRMAVSDNALDIAITDNGKGFDGPGDRDGHGLKNLSARLKKLGGTCIVESQVGGGTNVKIHLPLPAIETKAGAEPTD
jgi:signal transduction histidine kinase